MGPRGVEPLYARRSVSQSAGLQPAERKGTRAGGPARTDTVRGLGPPPLPIGLRRHIAGATGPTRTDTARGLKPLLPTSWATVASRRSRASSLMRAAGFEPALSAISGRRLLPIGLRARMADGGGIEPPHPCGLGAIAARCLTSRPTVQSWRKRQESNLQGLAARTVFETGPLANGVCASMGFTAVSGAPRWIRTSNLRVLSAAPLPIGLQGQFGDWDGQAR